MGHYEAVPARLCLQAEPVLATDNLPASLAAAGHAPAENLRVVGCKADAGTIEQARIRTEALVNECRRRIAAGESKALMQLLGEHPELVEHEWVGEAVTELTLRGEFKRGRGRPHSRYRFHPLVVVAMVEALIKTREAANPEKAFYALQGYGVLSYDAAKNLYYRARDERFKPTFITFESLKQEISREEYERRLEQAQHLAPGQTLQYYWAGSRAGADR